MPRVLVVDDYSGFGNVVRQRLRGVAEVDQAWSLREARQAIARSSYEGLVLDVYLRDGKGIELLPTIRESLPEAEVLIVSGEHDPKEIADRWGAWSVEKLKCGPSLDELGRRVAVRSTGKFVRPAAARASTIALIGADAAVGRALGSDLASERTIEVALFDDLHAARDALERGAIDAIVIDDPSSEPEAPSLVTSLDGAGVQLPLILWCDAPSGSRTAYRGMHVAWLRRGASLEAVGTSVATGLRARHEVRELARATAGIARAEYDLTPQSTELVEAIADLHPEKWLHVRLDLKESGLTTRLKNLREAFRVSTHAGIEQVVNGLKERARRSTRHTADVGEPRTKMTRGGREQL